MTEVPRHITQRILEGEGALQVWREHRCIPIATLARKVGISPSALMELESEGQSPDLDLLTRIASVLSVSTEDLTATQNGSDKVVTA